MNIIAEIRSYSPQVARVIVEILQIIQRDTIWLKNFGPRITVVRSLVRGFEAAVCQAYFFTPLFFLGLATRFQVRNPAGPTNGKNLVKIIFPSTS